MRRGVRAAVWALVAVMVAGVVGYILLAVGRGISPPIVPITSTTRIHGYRTGDAVLIDRADRLLRRGDLAVARARGAIRTVIVESIGSDDTGNALYRVGGFADGRSEKVPSSEVIGFAGRKVVLVGWPLLALRQPLGQGVLAALVAAVVVALFLSRPAQVAADDSEPMRLPLPPLLAIGPGPALAAASAEGDEPAEPAAPGGGRPEGPIALEPPTSVAMSLGVVPGALPVPYLGDSMSISPDDLRQVRFAQSRRGYDTDAVDRALDAVADTLESLIQERVELIEQIKRLERDAERLRGAELGLTQALNAAKAETEAIKAEATRLVSAAQGAAASNPGPSTAGDPAMVQLLGETRAMRSLLQSFLTQVHDQATNDPSEGRPA